MVISSEFHMRGYEDDDHQHDAHLFIKIMFPDSEASSSGIIHRIFKDINHVMMD